MNKFVRSRRKRPSLHEAGLFQRNGVEVCMNREDFVSVAERKKRLQQVACDLEEKLNKHLPRSRNLELVVLKCHILIEFMFNQFIDLVGFTEGAIDSERFTFKQKEAIVYLLGLPPNSKFFATVDLLNAVRNSVAHKLNSL